MQNPALFHDKLFSNAYSFAGDSLFKKTFQEANYSLLTLATLPAFLNNADIDSILFMGHNEEYPSELENEFFGYLKSGGTIVWLGGQPFNKNPIWCDYGWGTNAPCDFRHLGISPWYVEPIADLNPEEQVLAITPEFARFFGSAEKFHTKKMILRLTPLGAGRKVTIGEVVEGASTYACNDVFSLVEPGLPWNENGARIVCLGATPGRAYSLRQSERTNDISAADLMREGNRAGFNRRKCRDFINGLIEVIEKDAVNRLKLGVKLEHVARPQGQPFIIEVRRRRNYDLKNLIWQLKNESGDVVSHGEVNGNNVEIPTDNLNPGRFKIMFLDEGKDLGVNEWIAVCPPKKASPVPIAVAIKNGYAVCKIGTDIIPLHSYCGYANPRTIESIIPGFRKAGIHIYHIGITLEWGWIGNEKYDWESYNLIMEAILREDPEAWIFPRVRLTPPQWWKKEHPDCFWHHEPGLDGKQRSPQSAQFMSYFSSKWKHDTENTLKSYISFSKSQWYADRFIGVFYTYGSTGEWGEEPKDALFWADHHPECVEKFRDFLKNKYKTDEALQKAWKKIDDVQSEELRVNNSHFFRLNNPKHHLLDDMSANLTLARQTSVKTLENATIPNALRRRIGKMGILRDPLATKDLIDFLEFYSKSFSFLQRDLSSACKAPSPENLLTGTFCGYTLGGPYEVDGGYVQGDFPGFLDVTENLDLLTTASFYYAGENPTGDSVCKSLHESYALHGKIYLQEMDQHTSLSKVGSNRYGTPEGDIKTDIGTIKRNWVLRTTRGAGFWWFDFSFGFYDHPELIETLRKLQDINKKIINTPNPDAFADELTKCAVVYSARSHFYTTASSNFLRRVGDNFTQRHLNRIGIPWDIYFPEDLESAPARKIYLFLNAFYLTNRQRETINEKLKRNGNILIWLHAQGAVDETSCDITNTSKLTGFKLTAKNEWRKQRIELINHEHPISKDLAGVQLPDFGSVVTDDSGTSPELDRISPYIHVTDDDAIPLGVQEDTGDVAFAVKEFDNWTSIYASAAIIPAPVLRSIFKWKGIKLHTDALDTFYTNGDLLGLNALESGYKTIRFPSKFKLEDLFSGEVYHSDNGEVKVWVKYRDTLIARISKEN